MTVVWFLHPLERRPTGLRTSYVHVVHVQVGIASVGGWLAGLDTVRSAVVHIVHERIVAVGAQDARMLVLGGRSGAAQPVASGQSGIG